LVEHLHHVLHNPHCTISGLPHPPDSAHVNGNIMECSLPDTRPGDHFRKESDGSQDVFWPSTQHRTPHQTVCGSLPLRKLVAPKNIRATSTMRISVMTILHFL
jgi:hypothetical protein